MATMQRRAFVKRGAAVGGGLAVMGPLGALSAQTAHGAPPERVSGYGPLVLKTDGQNALMLPEEFDFITLDRQGTPMSDGNPTPGIFDGMGAFRGRGGRTILIRNHENRERPGETPVVVPDPYDPTTIGGCTKVVVRRKGRGRPTKEESFAIIGGTSTNCAGGVTPWESWITCEEVVKRGERKHGYNFEVDAGADEPVEAQPIRAAGRFAHEATVFLDGILYQTEDRSTSQGGALFYRYVPDDRVRRAGELAESEGVLEALKLKDEFRADMDVSRVVGRRYDVEWVRIDAPDHDDDTDSTPIATRFQGQEKGAAVFDREEGAWVGDRRVYFDCTSGGKAGFGQVWEYDPKRETITLIFESPGPEVLDFPDNVVIVPKTGDIFLQEDSQGDQYVRGVTRDGRIYDFAMAVNNTTEFCGGCFDPDGDILYLNQQGERGGGVDGPPDKNAVTYAIFGPFSRRRKDRSRDDRPDRGRDDGPPREDPGREGAPDDEGAPGGVPNRDGPSAGRGGDRGNRPKGGDDGGSDALEDPGAGDAPADEGAPGGVPRRR